MKFYNRYKISDILDEAHYIINNGATIRDVSNAFNVPIGTVYNHVNYYLKWYDPELHLQVREVIDSHKSSGRKGVKR